VVVLHFPFSDLSQSKRRPAFVLAPLLGHDIILCQITSQARSDSCSVPVSPSDFASGGLSLPSHIRPNRLFTADEKIVLYRVGHLPPAKVTEVIARLFEIIDSA